MKLRAYLEREEISPVEFASRIQKHFTTVYDYMRDDGDPRLKRPRIGTLDDIERETRGAVSASDFYGSTRHAKRPSRRRKAG